MKYLKRKQLEVLVLIITIIVFTIIKDLPYFVFISNFFVFLLIFWLELVILFNLSGKQTVGISLLLLIFSIPFSLIEMISMSENLALASFEFFMLGVLHLLVGAKRSVK